MSKSRIGRNIRYSEIFYSFQGEGHYTGVPTAWIRLWGCNLSCDGFGQEHPDKPETWELPYKDFDTSLIKVVEELPVWHRGCDSSYSWESKFRHLAKLETADVIAKKLTDCITSKSNPDGIFHNRLHSFANGPIHIGTPAKVATNIHLAFTGGEPMMNQTAIVDILSELELSNNLPSDITIETNGTRPITTEFAKFISDISAKGVRIFWSVSPKLWISGENIEKTILPEVVSNYATYRDHGQLKFVMDNSERSWNQLEDAVQKYRDLGIDWPVWIMPVGADLEMQNEVGPAVARETLSRGYNVAARVHTFVFGNSIGT